MISRATYKTIKGMNHKELNTYLEQLHATAYNQGVSAITSSITDKIIRGLSNTKGIGEKRMADIISNINAEIQKGDNNEN